MAENKTVGAGVKRQIRSLKRKVKENESKASTARAAAKSASSKARAASETSQQVRSRARRAEQKASKAVNVAHEMTTRARKRASKAEQKARKAVQTVESETAKAKRTARSARSRARVAEEKAKASQKRAARVAKKASTAVETAQATEKKTARVAQKTVELDRELGALRNELDSLKKKPRSTRSFVSEYNVFMRKMIKRGLSFKAAAREWTRLKKLEKKRSPSPYNQFVASQLRQGKSFKESVALWNRLKKGPPKARTVTKTKVVVRRAKPKVIVRTRTKTRTKTVVKRIKSKPREIVKYRTRTVKVPQPERTLTVEKPVQIEKPVFVTKEVFPEEKMRRLLSETINEHRLTSLVTHALNASRSQAVTTSERVDTVLSRVSESMSHVGSAPQLAAFAIVRTYFEEVARFGLKKSLTLDELVDAFFYVLGKVRPAPAGIAMVSNEEIAHKLTHLYFQEVARLGIKRKLDLDEVVQAYFYTLERLNAMQSPSPAPATAEKKDPTSAPDVHARDAAPAVVVHAPSNGHVAVEVRESSSKSSEKDAASPAHSSKGPHSASFHG